MIVDDICSGGCEPGCVKYHRVCSFFSLLFFFSLLGERVGFYTEHSDWDGVAVKGVGACGLLGTIT